MSVAFISTQYLDEILRTFRTASTAVTRRRVTYERRESIKRGAELLAGVLNSHSPLDLEGSKLTGVGSGPISDGPNIQDHPFGKLSLLGTAAVLPVILSTARS